ncbi:hypothetical protein CXF68_09740 [Tenacibaculum sp. Bg11-29]|uniref:hypothetical protein n=1 Tax=Tenacibaculum sp. Bg11-29 TaxID=2058306 RepID=UPI000C343B7D|nr:hypothetical protein [Tenacibaculum sp. Bg11-29]PKH50947.1 hypothetical protein CXF68_09740 [Tenacibaculum sp. Bg11-29]
MNRGKLIIFISSAILNIALLYFLFSKSENIDRTPYLHPFELNSNLNLKSIVKNGYKFASMPCGQVQYTKQIADTIIQYEVGIDCDKYEGKYEMFMFPEEEEIEEETEGKSDLKTTYISKTLEEEIAENKYYPWELKEIENCYQEIKWRVYTINFGKDLDLEKVRNFIYKKGGNIVNENWNKEKGGNAIVYYRNNSLYFNIGISKDEFSENNKTWVFNITRTIPYLDFEKIRKNTEQQKKRDKYYGQ